jgi:hypothetical protein
VDAKATPKPAACQFLSLRRIEETLLEKAIKALPMGFPTERHSAKHFVVEVAGGQ